MVLATGEETVRQAASPSPSAQLQWGLVQSKGRQGVCEFDSACEEGTLDNITHSAKGFVGQGVVRAGHHAAGHQRKWSAMPHAAVSTQQLIMSPLVVTLPA